MAKKKTRFDELYEACEKAGFYVARYSPGDGVTRYRFFSEKSSYFGPKNGDETVLGYKHACIYARGRGANI